MRSVVKTSSNIISPKRIVTICFHAIYIRSLFTRFISLGTSEIQQPRESEAIGQFRCVTLMSRKYLGRNDREKEIFIGQTRC